MKNLDSKIVDMVNDNFWALISDDKKISLSPIDYNILSLSIPEYDGTKEIENPIIYNNLGQCTGHRVCYLKSTDVEQNNWHRLLWSVPDEMLYFLSLNREIIIFDKSRHKHNKIERVFIPVLIDLLNYLYFKEKPKNKQYLCSYIKAVEAIEKDKNLYKKYIFWKEKIKNINIRCITIRVGKEPNLIYNKTEENKNAEIS